MHGDDRVRFRLHYLQIVPLGSTCVHQHMHSFYIRLQKRGYFFLYPRKKKTPCARLPWGNWISSNGCEKLATHAPLPHSLDRAYIVCPNLLLEPSRGEDILTGGRFFHSSCLQSPKLGQEQRRSRAAVCGPWNFLQPFLVGGRDSFQAKIRAPTNTWLVLMQKFPGYHLSVW